MSSTNEQTAWVSKVLGIQLAGAGFDIPAPLKIWTAAKDSVDQQLNALFGVLRKLGVPVLGVIAGEIEDVMAKYRVALTTALMDYESAPAGAKEAARAKALKAIATYKTSLPNNKHVIAADTNPFKVKVTVRQTVGKALDQISQQLG